MEVAFTFSLEGLQPLGDYGGGYPDAAWLRGVQEKAQVSEVISTC